MPQKSSSSSISTNISSPAAYLEIENNSVSDLTNDASCSILTDVDSNLSKPNTSSTPEFNKRKGEDGNCVPRLKDSKHRHLEKRLSKSQRDEILLKEAKEEGLFQMELCQAIKDSNKLFADAKSDISKSFMLMSETIKIFCSKKELLNNNNSNNNNNYNILWYLPISQLTILISLQHNKRSKDRYFIP